MKICIFQASLPQIVSDFIRQNICLKCHTSQNIWYKKKQGANNPYSLITHQLHGLNSILQNTEEEG